MSSQRKQNEEIKVLARQSLSTTISFFVNFIVNSVNILVHYGALFLAWFTGKGVCIQKVDIGTIVVIAPHFLQPEGFKSQLLLASATKSHSSIIICSTKATRITLPSWMYAGNGNHLSEFWGFLFCFFPPFCSLFLSPKYMLKFYFLFFLFLPIPKISCTLTHCRFLQLIHLMDIFFSSLVYWQRSTSTSPQSGYWHLY